MNQLKIMAITILGLLGTQAIANNQKEQDRMNIFYSPENILTLEIVMTETDWLKVKNAEPNGGCSKTYVGHRYDWVEANAMLIKSSLEKQDYQYNNVGIKKKSACGSKDNTKPSLNINLTKYNADNSTKAKDEIGTTHLTLNNSKQDNYIIKQCFGYYLFRESGLPASRCNFTSVYIKTEQNTEYLGIYVNVEPIKKNYLKNSDNSITNTDKGYLYEVDEHDFDLDGVIYNGYKGYSDVEDYIRVDYAMTAEAIQGGRSVSGIERSFEKDEFLTFWAMEIFVQHWDGYTRNVKNAYAYNDTDIEAVDNSAAGFNNNLTGGSVNFKMLPWGIDQIMQTPSCREIYHCADVSSGLYTYGDGNAEVNARINELVEAFRGEQTTISDYLKLLGYSAKETLGDKTDPLTGANSQTIDAAVVYLQNWFNEAIADGPISTTCCTYTSCSSKRCF